MQTTKVLTWALLISFIGNIFLNIYLYKIFDNFNVYSCSFYILNCAFYYLLFTKDELHTHLINLILVMLLFEMNIFMAGGLIAANLYYIHYCARRIFLKGDSWLLELSVLVTSIIAWD